MKPERPESSFSELERYGIREPGAVLNVWIVSPGHLNPGMHRVLPRTEADAPQGRYNGYAPWRSGLRSLSPNGGEQRSGVSPGRHAAAPSGLILAFSCT